jgi:pSer/pThr/pTyr-binding forkhead associated (FHA) protein
MARLILSLDNQVLAEYNMTKERYTVGRLPDNDVRIDNPAVSGHHSLIINILNDSFLEDLNSTNGTYVNGKLIKKHALQHGDVITIGHHQLRFADQQINEPEQDEFEKTMVIPTGQQSAAQLARAEAAADKAAAAARQARPAAPAPAPDAGVRLDPEEAAALDEQPVRKASVAVKPEVLFLKLFQPARLINAHAAIFAAPSIVSLLGNANSAHRLARGLASTEPNLNLTQLRNNLFWLCSLRHVSAPLSKPRLTDSPGHSQGCRPLLTLYTEALNEVDLFPAVPVRNFGR